MTLEGFGLKEPVAANWILTRDAWAPDSEL